MTISNISRHHFSLSFEVQLSCDSSSFLMTTVYGPVEESDKPIFLIELAAIKPTGSTPWIALGDFNLIYEARDKNNTNINHRLMGQFWRTLDECELLEIALQNHKYTWSNECAMPMLIRLDHVFCNKEWDLRFSGFVLQALPSSLSDHCSLFLCQQIRPRQLPAFHFENFWVKVPKFIQVVQAAWNDQVPGISPLNIMFYKMKHTVRALKSWSNKLFSKVRLELHMANEIIQQLDLA
jgi:hypothetical protein